METSPCRLFVLLASKAPVGVILRRGPSGWVQLIHWDTKNDVFTPGQWFHGRIYEHRCDISPNGTYFVYCAYKPGNGLANPTYGDRWTAVSKPPYFTAFALWPLTKKVGGGGLFTERKTLLLNHWKDNTTAHPNHRMHHLEIIEADGNTFMRNSVMYTALLKNEWKFESYSEKANHLPLWYKGTYIELGDPRIHLKKWGREWPSENRLHCRVFYRYRVVKNRGRLRHSVYQVVPEYHYSIGRLGMIEDIPLPDVTWVDFDHQNRVVLAKEGKLFIADLDQEHKLKLTELADFNANKPEAIETPKWAKRW